MLLHGKTLPDSNLHSPDGYNTDEIAFRWISTNKSENVFFSNSLHDGKFDLVNVDTVSRVESYGMAGELTSKVYTKHFFL